MIDNHENLSFGLLVFKTEPEPERSSSMHT
jgi:hypothetical protein